MEIEVRNLDIEWNDSRQFVRIKEKGDQVIPILEESGNFTINTITYQNMYFCIGFRILSENTLHTPYFVMGDRHKELLQLQDPETHEIWWIQQGVWLEDKNGKGKYVYRTIRTTGILQLIIQGQRLQINNNTNNFTVEELEYFLSDFKNNLWEIILDDKSMIGSNIEKKVPNVFSDEVIKCLDRFIEAGKRITKEPKFFLKEIQGMVSRAKVKPVPRTFRELATKNEPKLLSSRLHQTSFDTADNRYVHYCVDRLYYLLGKMTDVSDNLKERFTGFAENYKQDSDTYKSKQIKHVSKGLFEKEIIELRKKVGEIDKVINTDIPAVLERSEINGKEINERLVQIARSKDFRCFNADETVAYEFSIDRFYGYGNRNAFFCNYLNGKNFKEHADYRAYEKKSLVVEYPQDIFDVLKPLECTGVVLDVEGIVSWAKYDKICKFVWRKIHQIQVRVFEYELSLDAIAKNKSSSVFCNYINKQAFKNNNLGYSGSYLIVTFPDEIFENLKPLVGKKISIKVRGFLSIKAGIKFCEFTWIAIDLITLSNYSPHVNLRKREERSKYYENNNWQIPYTPREKQELIKEANNLDSRASYYIEAASKYSVLNQRIGIRYKKLRELKLSFQNLGIGKNNNFPNSMVFVQNPEYSAIYSNFKAIQERSNLNVTQLDSLIVIEQLGLIDIPRLYERWVLLQIIKVLTEDFHLTMEEGWQAKLVQSYKDGTYYTEFKMRMPDNQLELVLAYEKQLPNRNRPDYILDIYRHIYEKTDSKNQWGIAKTVCSRLVMDAKFHDDHTESEINETLDNLYRHSGKDYSENGENKVFIIHASPFAIRDTSSPLVWNGNCDYGHVSPMQHKKGHIFLLPSLRYKRSIDNLKRLILMHFQSATTIPLGYKVEHRSTLDFWHNYICSHCGAGPNSLTMTPRKTLGGGDSWSIACNECKGYSSENFCYSCKTRLFKNGMHWTYHRTYAEEITNCRCPKCDADLYSLQDISDDVW